MRYDFAALEDMVLRRVGPQMVRVPTNHAGLQEKELGRARILAEQFSVTKRTILRWRRFGLSEKQADALAVQEGLHPLSVWPHWDGPTPEQPFDVGLGDLVGPACDEHPAPDPNLHQEVRVMGDLTHVARHTRSGAA